MGKTMTKRISEALDLLNSITKEELSALGYVKFQGQMLEAFDKSVKDMVKTYGELISSVEGYCVAEYTFQEIQKHIIGTVELVGTTLCFMIYSDSALQVNEKLFYNGHIFTCKETERSDMSTDKDAVDYTRCTLTLFN